MGLQEVAEMFEPIYVVVKTLKLNFLIQHHGL